LVAFAAALVLWSLAALIHPAIAIAERRHPRVQVADAYIELRTGPGRVFPIYQVVERGQWVEILKRRTDWFKVRTPRGRTGWVDRGQMERTLTEAGVRQSFRDVLLADYLNRRLEVGVAAGLFEGDTITAVRLGYRLNPSFMVEATYAQVSGTFSSTQLYHGNLVVMPFPRWRLSPYLTVGGGRFHNTPRATLVDRQETDATALNAGLGCRLYLTRRFVLRADFRDFAVLIDDNRTDNLQAWTAGLSFFF